MMNEFRTRGELARLAGVKVATVRYYERCGLLTDAFHSANGYHYYDRDALERLRFIRRGQELGFSLKEIGELLDLRVDSETASAADVRDQAEMKIREIRRKITDLQMIKTALDGLVEACSGNGSARECPILQELKQEDVRIR